VDVDASVGGGRGRGRGWLHFGLCPLFDDVTSHAPHNSICKCRESGNHLQSLSPFRVDQLHIKKPSGQSDKSILSPPVHPVNIVNLT